MSSMEEDMEEIRVELRTYSRYIRDNLIPLLANEGKIKLNNRDMDVLRSKLNRVNMIPMTIDLLLSSRIEKALFGIAAANVEWPADIPSQARNILRKWEYELGPVHNLHVDLWAPGGRLEGVRKLEKVRDDKNEKDTGTRSQWSVERVLDSSRPYAFGSLQFPIGAWWIKAAAAFRDGIIDQTSDGITANQHGAYAIVMKNHEETMTAKEGLVRYLPSSLDPGIFKLISTIRSEVRSVVRVLRSWKLKSPLAPVSGLRYDGLYRVVSYGVKLEQDRDGNDEWKYSFELRREPDQASIKDALSHPTADEIDDWEDYRRAKTNAQNGRSSSDSTVLHLSTAGLEKERTESIDSGYFSALAPIENAARIAKQYTR